MTQHEAKTTIDHMEIRRWVEDRGGSPAFVRGTQGGDGGVLRIDFPDPESDPEPLEHIAWEEFFRVFDERQLAFLYQNETKEGELSFFNKFVSRDI